MPTPLVTQYYPNDFHVFTFQTLDRANSAVTDGSITSTALIYADRDIAIDSIVIGVGASASGNAMTFGKTTAGTASSPASPLFISSGTTLISALTGSTSVAAAGTVTATLLTPSNDTNVVRAGNWFGVVYTAGTLASLRATVQIRFRSAIA